MANSTPTIQEIKDLIKQIKDKGLLPKGFAKKIAEKLDVTTQKVYQISNGVYYNEEIADEILKIAKDNKLKQQADMARDILS